MTGRTLGHYQILEKLGSGGMGDVYKGRVRVSSPGPMPIRKRGPNFRVGDDKRAYRPLQLTDEVVDLAP